jgi:hypothetical protein
MSTPFATVNDIETLWRPLTSAEQTKAAALLPLVSDELRVLANEVNKNLDEMAAADEAYASVLKIVTVDVTVRVIRQSTEGEAMTQESQSALGYSWSGTYAVAGGGIANAILNNDLKKLGLKTQQIGVMYTWQGSKVSQ